NVNGKTAALFQLAASEGAHFAGADRQTTAYAARFGQNLGIAFQMIDDLLDYTDQGKLNKPVMQDLATGVYSLPLLMALQQPATAKELQPLLEQPLTHASEQQIKTIVINSGALDEARQLAQRFTQKADQWLAKLPDSPAQRLLGQLTQQLMQRTV
ncbi:MAG: polyprenyl synthetase family protein, partial [Limosilactobacillus mucosae]|nr:polyprenyl synthetase family protein [Limosilactobacillus mucosae]